MWLHALATVAVRHMCQTSILRLDVREQKIDKCAILFIAMMFMTCDMLHESRCQTPDCQHVHILHQLGSSREICIPHVLERSQRCLWHEDTIYFPFAKIARTCFGQFLTCFSICGLLSCGHITHETFVKLTFTVVMTPRHLTW